MTSDHLQVRISKLITKCRKAVRLYSSMAKIKDSKQRENYAINKSQNDAGHRLQMLEWKEVNQLLLEELQEVFSMYRSKQLVESIYVIRDNYQSRWRSAEAELHVKTKKLSLAVEGGQFLHARALCEKLIVLKAREEATQAAYSELQSVLDMGSVARPRKEDLSVFDPSNKRGLVASQGSIPLSFDEENKKAKIIPLRKKQV